MILKRFSSSLETTLIASANCSLEVYCCFLGSALTRVSFDYVKDAKDIDNVLCT
jgi:hypothetical protein